MLASNCTAALGVKLQASLTPQGAGLVSWRVRGLVNGWRVRYAQTVKVAGLQWRRRGAQDSVLTAPAAQVRSAVAAAVLRLPSSPGGC